MGDRVLGLIGLALAGFYIWSATTIRESFIQDAVGPKTFPIILGIVLALASLYFVLRPDPAPDWSGRGRLLEVGAAIVVMMAYAMALPRLGFVLATLVATTYLSWRLGSSPLMSGVIGVATAVGLYVIFAVILGLGLAEGPFGF